MVREYRKFSQEETEFIKRYYREYGPKFCADALGVPIVKIREKARVLGITRSKDEADQASRFRKIHRD